MQETYNNKLYEKVANQNLIQSLQEQKITKEHYFDLHKPFGYVEAFSTIGVVCVLAFMSFLLLRYFKPKCKS